MLKLPPRTPTGWAVHEDSPLDCNQIGLSLEEAFHSIMAHCAYAPAWDEDGKRLRLRFRYLDEPHQGRFVGDTEPGPEITSYLEPLTHGAFVARDAIMKRVAAAGHCGWYAVRMSEFIVDHMHAGHVAREDARDKGASTWG